MTIAAFETLEARQLDLSLKRKAASASERAVGGAAEGGVQFNAHACTAGSDIFCAARRYRPEPSEGKRLLAHELAHVAQQGESARSGAQFIHRQATNPLKGRSTSEVVDYRAQPVIDDALQP